MKKLIAIAIAVTMAVVAVPAAGQTDLQAQIDALLAQIAALQAQLAGGTSAGAPAVCSGISFTRNLSLGSTGNDVKCLQALLNQDSATQVAASGVGAMGSETTYFGNLTATAVVKFQNKYASEVLAPVGLTSGTGFVGAQTRAKLNAMLVSTPTTPPTDPTTPTDPVVQTEGDLEVKLLGVPNNVEVGQDSTNVGVMSFELKAKDSDITVRRIDIRSDGTVKRPSKNLSQVSLYDGSTLLSGVSADSYARPTGQTYFEYRYNVNLVIPKGTTKTVNVMVSSLSTVTNADSYTLSVPIDGIRFTDTAELSHTAPAAAIARTFTVTTAVTGILTNTMAPDNPTAGIVVGNETANTTGVELLKFQTKATQNNVVIDRVIFQATTTGTASAASLINAVHLYDGTTLVGSETFAAGTSTTIFDNLEISVAKNATKTFTVKVDLNKVDGTNATSGDTVLIGVSSMTGEDPLYNVVPASGVITGEAQTVHIAGVQVSNVSTSITNVVDGNNLTTHGDGTVTFRLTALGDTIVIPTTGAATGTHATTTASTGATTTAVEYMIDGNLIGSATLAQRTINAGTYKTITVRARVGSDVGSRVRLEVTALTWNDLDGNAFNAPSALLESLVTPTVIIDA
ncbi:MAG: hypothetical protein PHU39_00670 [Candidatus Pacebacteria bacterium]|nr:hypothetical protein [Candidatus Paceibacterota bacterium]